MHIAYMFLSSSSSTLSSKFSSFLLFSDTVLNFITDSRFVEILPPIMVEREDDD